MTRAIRAMAVMLVGLACSTATVSGQVFVSQYYEGTNLNKWIELYNAGTGTVNLGAGGYRLGLWQNAARENWKGGGAPSLSLALSGTVAPGATFVIRHGSATTPVYAVADQTNSTVLNFNGDDSVVLYLGATFSTTGIVDSIGLIATDLVDTSIVRKASVSTGNTGTNDYAASEWDGFSLASVDGAAPSTLERIGYHVLASGSATRYVALGNPTPVAPYISWATAATNIQDAIDAALAGDAVLVSNGVYETGGRVYIGSLLTNRVVIDKPVVVQSVNGPAVTTIKGAWDPVTTNGDAAVRCVWMTNGASLVGFTLTNGATRTSGGIIEMNGGGLIAVSSLATVSNCVISGNSAASNGGGAQAGTLNNCRLTGNSAGFSGGGARSAVLNNCTVTGNTAIEGGGGSLATLNNSIAYFNWATISNNYVGGTITYTCTTPLPSGGTGNITNDPQFVNAGAGNYRLQAGSPCRDIGDNAGAPGATDLDGNPRIDGGTVDLGAYEFQLAVTATVHYVNLNNPTPLWPHVTWATAANHIQDAVDAADVGDTVLVSNGVYETGGRTAPGVALTNRVFIDKAITVQSVNGPAVTTIRGAKDPSTLSNGNAAVRCVWMTNGATLVGFTITNGATRAAGNSVTEMSGGGVWCATAGAAVVSNCTLSGNSARSFGGGAYRVVLNNCTLSGNSANSGGGAFQGTLNNCISSGNLATSGGGTHSSTLNNCVVSGNSAASGGGAFQGTLNNCTLSGNSAGSRGGGSYNATLNNCIVYFNTSPAGPNTYQGTINHTCTTPLPAGSGNITTDPQFVNAGAGNYRLLPSSPCISVGNNAAAAGSTDLDGNARIVGGVVDMGAYEFDYAIRYVNIANPTPVAPYTNWLTAATNIQDAVDVAAAGDVVLVSNGVYMTGGRAASGSLLTNRVVIDKVITVRSVNGPAFTAIRGAGPDGDAAVRCVWMTHGASLAGFTLTNGATRTSGDTITERGGGGLWAASTSTRISGCILAGNSAAANGGGVQGGTLDNCLLTGNSAGFSGGGARSAVLNNCTVTGNSAIEGGGGSSATLNNSIVYFNSGTISNNYIGSTINYTCTTPLPSGGTGNITNDPQFVNAAAGNVRVGLGSPCINRGHNSLASGATDLDGNPRIAFSVVDMGAYELPQTMVATGLTHYVALDNPSAAFPYTNWTTAAANIQDAVDASSAGSLILVSNGLYATGGRAATGYSLTNRVLLDKAITVQSVNGPAATTIRGAWDPVTTNGSAAVRCVLITNGATLVGFTLTNGAVSFSTEFISEYSGGGAFGGTLNDCILTGNFAPLGGGACLSTLNRCTLSGNAVPDGNSGGGAYSCTLNQCTLTGNSAFDGGGASYSTLNNSTLTGNSVSYQGGGVSFSTLNNCTLTGNSASNEGGGAMGSTLNNCIVYFNSSPSAANCSFCIVSYTCTTPDPGSGTGNITNDPMFVSLATTNLQLAVSSSCINLGHNPFAPGTNDLAGNPRIVNTVVDMGAYEFQGAADPDYDNDGWSNAEEYIADTQPANGASFFPLALVTNAPAGQVSLVIGATSAGRVYGVYANTNLLQAPQTWTLVPPEQTGTASSLTLTITNALPAANYRAGVRLP